MYEFESSATFYEPFLGPLRSLALLINLFRGLLPKYALAWQLLTNSHEAQTEVQTCAFSRAIPSAFTPLYNTLVLNYLEFAM